MRPARLTRTNSTSCTYASSKTERRARVVEMSADDRDRALREHLLYLLRGGGAHIKFEEVVKDFPVELINGKTAGVPYTTWQLLEHMKIAQWDILGVTRAASHVQPEGPEG